MVLDSSNSDSSSGLSHDEPLIDPPDAPKPNESGRGNGKQGPDPDSDTATKPLANRGAEDPQLAAKQELGDYELLREIGRGGMGIVYEAKQISLEKRVAVKVLPFTGVLDQRIVKRFKNEAWAAAQLQHRNIVPVYQVGSERGIYYYAMRYIEGGDLSHLYHALQDAAHQNDPRNLKQAARRRTRQREKERAAKKEAAPKRGDQNETEAGPPRDLTVAPIAKRDSTHRSGWSKGDTLASKHLLDLVAKSGSTSIPGFLNALVKMGIQAADALHYAHETGIIHRDIKPSNLLLDEDGEVWVVDFGLAQIQNDPGVTATGAIIGTLRYMSPEQALGQRVGVDHRTDIYSLGVTLYELLTLNRAFSGESRESIIRKITFEDPIAPRKLDRRIPVELETIVRKAISKNPLDRYQTAEELADDLRRFRDNEPIRGRKPSVVQRLSRWGHRNRSVVVSGAVTLTLTSIIAVAGMIVSYGKTIEIAKHLTVVTEQKEEIERNYHRSEGLRLIANAQLNSDTDPGLALQLSLAGSKHYPGAEANTTIVESLDRLHEIHVFDDLSARVGHVAFNRDGTKLIACATNVDPKKGPVPAAIWDITSSDRLGVLKSKTTITSAAYARDNSRILVTSSLGRNKSRVDIDGQGIVAPVMIYEDVRMAPTGTTGILKDAFCFRADEAAFDPIGDRIVLPSLGHNATVYDAIGRGSLFTLKGHEKRVVHAAFSPGGNYLVTASDDNTVRIWKAFDGTPVQTFTLWKDRFPDASECLIDSVVFTADEKRLITGSTKAGTHAWDFLQTDAELNSDLHVASIRVQSGGNPFQLLTYSRSGKEVTIRDSLSLRSLRSGKPNSLLDKAVASPDGRWFVILSGAKELGLWDARTGEKRASLLGHRSMVNHIAFAPNSQLIATASDDQTVRLWNVHNGHQRATLPTATHFLRPLKVASHDGKTLAIAGLHPPPIHRLIDLEKEETVAEARGVPFMTKFGTHFVSVLNDRVSVHSAKDGMEIASITHPDGRVFGASVSPDGSRVVMKNGKTVTLWMVKQERLVRLLNSEESVNAVGFEKSGERLFAVTSDGSAHIWNGASGELMRKFSSGDNLVAAAFSHDGSRLAAVTNQDRVFVWDLDAPNEDPVVIAAGIPVGRILFGFDDKHLILYSGSGGTVLAWDLDQNEERSRLGVAGSLHVTAHPNRAEVLVASDKTGASIWNYSDESQQTVTESPMNHGGYDPDGKIIYLGSKVPHTVQMFGNRIDTQEFTASRLERWNGETLERKQAIEFPVAAVLEFEVAAGGRLAVHARNRFSMTLYDTESKTETSRVAGHRGPISASLFSPVSDELITTSWDRDVSLWNVADGKLIRKLSGHRSPVLCVATIGKDKIITGAHDGECIVWNRNDGRIDVRFQVSKSPIWHLDVDETRNEVMALTHDSKLHIRELGEGRPVRFNVGISSVAWAEYSPDASSLLIVPARAQADQPANSGNFVLVVPRNGNTIRSIDLGDAVKTSHFHPDGQRVITLTQNGTTTLRDAKSGKIEWTYPMPGVITVASVLSPDGEFLAVSTTDEIAIWKTDTASQWMTVPRFGRESSPPHLFTPFLHSRSSILSVLRKQQGIKVLPLNPEKTAKSLAPRDLTAREKARFFIEP